MTEERVLWYLWNWEIYSLRHKSTANGDGYPKRSLVLKVGDSSKTFEELCRTSDRRCARAVDAIVDGLPQDQKLAVQNVHLWTVYRIRDQAGSYEKAKEAIGKWLKIRGFE